MAIHKEIYAQARYYDIVFDRDVSQELNFAFGTYSELNGGKAPQSMIDIACGPGYYALQAAKRGLRSIGLDLREEMVDLGMEKAAEMGVNVQWLSRDMRDFKLDQPVDVAMIMLDSIDVLSTDEDAVNHFRAMYNNITPGGIYMIDQSHPREAAYGVYVPYSYTGQRDGIQIKITYDVNDDWNLLTGLIDTVAHIYVQHPDGECEHFESTSQERLYLPRELNALVKEAGGFKNIGWYGAFRKNQPLDFSTHATRQIAVYQRI